MAKKETKRTYDHLLLEIEELKSRLSESEDALDAIRNGEVDAIIVSGSEGEKIFSLTSAETPYRILLEEMNEGAMTLNSECNVLYCNQKFADLLSRPISQIIGANCNDVISVGEKEKFRELVKETHQNQTTGLFSFITETNASPRYLQFSFRLLPAGIPGEISIIASDVTSMKQYQEQLEELVKERTKEIGKINEKLKNDLVEIERAKVSLSESEQKYRTTLNSIADAVIATDIYGFVTYMNPLAEQITGWMFREGKNKPIGEIFNVIDEVTREEIENPVEQALEKGVIYVGLTNHTLLIRKDRIEIVIADSAAIIKDNNGNSTGVVLVFRDMTQKRLNDNLLRESEKNYREIVETSGEGIIKSTPEGKIVFANKKMAEMLGYDLDELIGKSGADLRFNDFDPSTIQQARDEMRRGVVIKGNFKFKHKNGSVLWTSYNASLCLIIREITQGI
jgi:PAS domain S-box-containing protein